MNYLFHLYLSDAGDDLLLGTLMGDFVKGRLPSPLPPGPLQGAALHRAQDVFASSDPNFNTSRHRLPSSVGHFRGIVVDIFYDHLLARHWDELYPCPLENFSRRIYRLLEQRHPELPPALQRLAPRIIAEDWLCGYARTGAVTSVLERMARRINGGHRLILSPEQLALCDQGMEQDFRAFVPKALEFSRQWIRQNLQPSKQGP